MRVSLDSCREQCQLVHEVAHWSRHRGVLTSNLILGAWPMLRLNERNDFTFWAMFFKIGSNNPPRDLRGDHVLLMLHVNTRVLILPGY